MDSNEIVTRTKFPESWLWSDIKLPPCPRNTPNWWVTVNHKHIQMKLHLNISQTVNIFLCFSDTTSFVKNVPLQDSITTWQFTGISLSRTHGEDSVTKIWLFLAFPLLFYFYSFLHIFFKESVWVIHLRSLSRRISSLISGCLILLSVESR